MTNPKYEAFLAIAQTHSFKTAAQDLGYTQAGISYLISALEKELGLTLFLRDYGEARLTADGRAILPRIEDVVASERQLETEVAELKDLEGGLVRVAAFTSTAIQWFPGIAKRFLELYPAIDLKLICIDDEAELAHQVSTGEVDCGFCVYPLHADLDAISLRIDPLYVVLPPQAPEVEASFITPEQLAAMPYIQLQDNAKPSEMEALFQANGVTPNVRFTVDSDYAVMAMVSAGLGFSVLPDLILHDPPFDLAIRPAQHEATREIAIAVRSFETSSAATRAFLQVAEEWVSQQYSQK